MDDINSPPPIPVRPGRAVPVPIQSIASLKPESRPNEYVDTNSIAVGISGPRLPPKTHKATTSSLSSKFTKDTEQCENVTNELREHLQVCKQQSSKLPTANDLRSPEIPPRSNRPPPVPPRDSKGAYNHRLSNTRPATSKVPSERLPTWKCNERQRQMNSATSTTSTTKSKIQPTVLIISNEPRLTQFPSTRSNRHVKTLRDSVSTSSQQPVVTQQPTATADVTLTLDGAGTVNNTIICPECGHCRCSDCTGDRKLPERWLCEGNCRCSADSVTDALSCMCCVKSCFRNCFDNPDDSRVNPCACTESPKCFLRWTALAALSVCLPCLCCYVPMQLGVAAATACYNTACCRKRGCNCQQN